MLFFASGSDFIQYHGLGVGFEQLASLWIKLVAMLHCSLCGASSLSLCMPSVSFLFQKMGSITSGHLLGIMEGGKKTKPDVAINSLINMCSTPGVNSGKAETQSNEFRCEDIYSEIPKTRKGCGG